MDGLYNVICVDDENIILQGIVSIVRDNPLVKNVVGFTITKGAIDYVKENSVDIAFLDVEMYQTNGIELARIIRSINPRVYIVFLTGYANFAIDAFGVHANGFLTKPAADDDIDKEIKHYDSVMKSVTPQKRLRVQTFGNFEVYIDDEAVHFSYHLSKEIFAYLIDRKGASVTMAELATVCEEYAKNENSAKSMIRTAVAELRKIANDHKMEDVIDKARNTIKIKTELVDCDYYSYLDGDIDAINSYTGEYMSNYSWAELTNAWLQNNAK